MAASSSFSLLLGNHVYMKAGRAKKGKEHWIIKIESDGKGILGQGWVAGENGKLMKLT
jgi:hypothetical protein